jgi:hypothetical protein
MLPTDNELTRARSDLEASMLPDTCNILTATRVVDALNGKEILVSGEIDPYHTYVLTLPQSATITTDSRVEHGSYTYEVRSVTLDRSWSLCKRAMVERV